MSYYSQIKRGMNVVVPKIFSDEGLTTTIIWKVFQGSVFDTTLRKNVETFNETSVTVVKVMKEFSSTAPRQLVPGAGGLIQGEIRYIAKMDDAPAGYSYRDLLVEGDVTYAVDEYSEVLHDFVIVDVKGLG